MSNVISLRKWVAKSIKACVTNEDQGKAQEIGRIEVVRTADGKSRLSVTGCYSNRLQLTAYTMVQALSEVSERIRASGTAGHTASDPIHVVTRPRRELPRRLRQSTGFGELR